MTKRLIGPVFSTALLVLIAGTALAWDADFDPSSFNPEVGESVTFAVCEPCLGDGNFIYEWDFDGDGSIDAQTREASTAHAYEAEGYYEVGLRLIGDDGRSRTQHKGILVGASAAFAVREVLPESDGTFFVLITINVTTYASAIGFEEAIPQGWQLEMLDTGGAMISRVIQEERKLVAAWGSAFDGGMEITFSYRLYPSYVTSSRELSGIVTGYDPGRFSGQVCGVLALP